MTLIKANAYANQARGDAKDHASDRLLPDYQSVPPHSPEAEALLAQWRPALYGYAAVFAEPALALVASRRSTIKDQVRTSRAERQTKGATVPSLLLAQTFGEMAPLLEVTLPRRPGWDNFREVTNILSGHTQKSINEVLQAAAKEGDVAVKHLTELVTMFKQLDLDNKRKPSHRYKSPAAFINAGVLTGNANPIKTAYLVGELVADAAQESAHAAFLTSGLSEHLASRQIGQFNAAELALTLGAGRAAEITIDVPFDMRSFTLKNDRGRARVHTLVPLDELAVATWGPGTRVTKALLNRARRVKDIATDPFPKGGGERDAIGCITLVKGTDGRTILADHLDFVAELLLETETWKQLMVERQRGLASISDSALGLYGGPSIARLMLDFGIATSAPSLGHRGVSGLGD